MTYKINLAIVKGRWYMSIGRKGYKSTHGLNKALSEWIPDRSKAVITFSDERTEDTIFRCVKEKSEYGYLMTLYNIKTGEIEAEHDECPHLLDDFSVGSEFFINYNPEW